MWNLFKFKSNFGWWCVYSPYSGPHWRSGRWSASLHCRLYKISTMSWKQWSLSAVQPAGRGSISDQTFNLKSPFERGCICLPSSEFEESEILSEVDSRASSLHHTATGEPLNYLTRTDRTIAATTLPLSRSTRLLLIIHSEVQNNHRQWSTAMERRNPKWQLAPVRRAS